MSQMNEMINQTLYQDKEVNLMMKSYIRIDEELRRWICTCGQFSGLNIYFMGMHIRDIHFPKMALSILSPEYKIITYNIACNLVQCCSSITTDESGYIIPRQIKKNKKTNGPGN